jgi:hypothetical protein
VTPKSEHLHAGFADRLAYLRWLRALGRLRPETDGELADAWGVGEKWLWKWKKSAVAPEGRTEEKAISEVVGELVARWLYDGTDPAPRADLWREWVVARSLEPMRATDPKAVDDFIERERAASRAYDAERAAERATPPAAPRAAGGARKAAGGTKGKSRGR